VLLLVSYGPRINKKKNLTHPLTDVARLWTISIGHIKALSYPCSDVLAACKNLEQVMICWLNKQLDPLPLKTV